MVFGSLLRVCRFPGIPKEWKENYLGRKLLLFLPQVDDYIHHRNSCCVVLSSDFVYYPTALLPGSRMHSRDCSRRRRMLSEPNTSLFFSKYECQSIYCKTLHPLTENSLQQNKRIRKDLQISRWFCKWQHCSCMVLWSTGGSYFPLVIDLATCLSLF